MKKLFTRSKTGKTIKLTFVLYVFAVAVVLIVVNACKKSSPSGLSDIPVNREDNAIAENTTRLMTVAAIRPSENGKTIEVRFFESERIFLIENENNGEAIARLQQSLKNNIPARVTINTFSPTISQVSFASGSEIQAHSSMAVMQSVGKVYTYDVATTTPDKINTIQNWQPEPGIGIPSTSNGLTTVIPDLATAQMIFNYFAQQACNLPGPYGVDYCISFQYVEDGCYARAHKMRWILENKYHYYVQKVFSFAINGSDVLAVMANKWGGCCIGWWYHVAPLVNIRTPSGVKAYVMDPAMFDQPVLLSTWLGAQQDKRCNVNGHVSKYSIQPATAYWPTNGTGTTFGTDPFYSSTDTTMVHYGHLKSCP